MSDSSRPCGLQHARLLCPPMASVICSNPHPLSWWCYQTISSSAAPSFAFNLFQHRRFLMNLHFASGSWNIGASASASVLPMSIQCWSFLWLTGFISLLFKGCSGVFSSTTFQKPQFFGVLPSLWSNSHIHTWLKERPLLWLYRSLPAKWCLCFLTHIIF